MKAGLASRQRPTTEFSPTKLERRTTVAGPTELEQPATEPSPARPQILARPGIKAYGRVELVGVGPRRVNGGLVLAIGFRVSVLGRGREPLPR
jgi:hypothetical protein